MVQIVTTVLWKIESVIGKQEYKILKILVEVNNRSNTQCQASQLHGQCVVRLNLYGTGS
jgi:hypothetical protein